MRRSLLALTAALSVTLGTGAALSAAAPASAASAPSAAADNNCDFNLKWTAKRHSGGEDRKHRAVITAEPTKYNGHKYWGLSLAWAAFPGNRIGCYELKNHDGDIFTGSGPGGISLCSGNSCDTGNRYVRLRMHVIHDNNPANTSSLHSDLPGTIHRDEVTSIRGHLRFQHGDPGQRGVSLEWWPDADTKLSHVCHFKPNTTMNTTTGEQKVYLTPNDGDFHAKLRPGCFPSKGSYIVAVSSLNGFPQARSSKQTVSVKN